jgi:hypothetical protein
VAAQRAEARRLGRLPPTRPGPDRTLDERMRALPGPAARVVPSQHVSVSERPTVAAHVGTQQRAISHCWAHADAPRRAARQAETGIPLAPARPLAPESGKGKPRRGPEAASAMMARAAQLDLVGPMPGDEPPAGAHPGPVWMAELERRRRFRAQTAMDIPRTMTALEWWADFLVFAEGRTMWVSGRGQEGAAGRAWNRDSLDLFDEFMAEARPKGRSRGEHVSTTVRSGYGACVRLLRSREAGYDVAPPAEAMYAPLARKAQRRREPVAVRKLGAGLRAVHLRRAADVSSFDRSSVNGELRWAAALLAHNVLLRGGEVGIPDNAESEPRRVLRGRSFQWMRPVAGSLGRPWLVVWVVPIKDPDNKKPARPIPVARRHEGPFGADPMCTYDAVAAMWWRRAHPGRPFPRAADGSPAADWWLSAVGRPFMAQPMFTGPDGLVVTTSAVRVWFQSVAKAAGLDPTPFGAKAARIGGATDTRALYGEAGKRLAQRRGRWESDVAEVYQRDLALDHLALSAALADAAADSLEEVCDGWVQPA